MTDHYCDTARPRMDEPTHLGSVVVAKVGDSEEQFFVLRPGNGDGPALWVPAHGYGYRWRYLTDPRPPTEQEIREGQVEKSDLLGLIENAEERIKAAAGSLETLRHYASALEADEKRSLFAEPKPKKTLAVGDMTEEGDAELLPIGSRVENYCSGYWEKTGEDEWFNVGSGETWNSDAIRIAGRNILRVGHEEPKKTFTVGGVTEEGDVESLPIGSRIENLSAAYWQKTGEDEWTDEGDGRVWPSDAIRMLGRKILRVGHDEPKRPLELGDVLFTKEDFEAVPKGHVVVEIVSPKSRYFKDGERSCDLHHNLFVDDTDYFTARIAEGHFYYLYGGEPVPSVDTRLPLREAFNAWGANAIVELVNVPSVAFTLSPDGAAHFTYGKGGEASEFLDHTVRLVTVLDDGKVIPGEVDRKVAAFKPGDVVWINGGPFHGQRGHVLRADLNLDSPYLVRAEGTTGFGRYEADDLTLSRMGNVLDTAPGDRIRNSMTGETHTVTRASGLGAAHQYEFLMPKRAPKSGEVFEP